MSVIIKNIKYSINKKNILNDVSLEIKRGEMLTIVGPNGSGKSSLIKIISGDISAQSGEIIFDNVNLDKISIFERAKIRSVMSQSQQIVYDFKVKEIIEMGWIDCEKELIKDNFQETLNKISKQCEVYNILDRTFNTLSGGEQKRVHFARTLMQISNKSYNKKSKYIFLDEPTASLDLNYEIQLMKVLKQKTLEGFGVFIVLHDLNLAYNFADKIALIDKGKIKTTGTPKEVLNKKNLSEVYKTDIDVNHKQKLIKYY